MQFLQAYFQVWLKVNAPSGIPANPGIPTYTRGLLQLLACFGWTTEMKMLKYFLTLALSKSAITKCFFLLLLFDWKTGIILWGQSVKGGQWHRKSLFTSFDLKEDTGKGQKDHWKILSGVHCHLEKFLKDIVQFLSDAAKLNVNSSTCICIFF